MKKNIALRYTTVRDTDHIPTQSRFSIQDWMVSERQLSGDKKHILKGFVDLSAKKAKVWIQSNPHVETSHEKLIVDEYAHLGSREALFEGVVGFQLRYKPETHILQFNPSSNHFGSVTSVEKMGEMWTALCNAIDFSDSEPELYIKSKNLSKTFVAELQTITRLETVNKSLIPHFKLNNDGTMKRVAVSNIPRRESFESDSSVSSDDSGDYSSNSLSAMSVKGISDLFSSPLTQDIPTGDVIHHPSLYTMMSSLVEIMTPYVEGKHAFALGNSLSWPLELISAKTETPVGFIPFSGNSVDFAVTSEGPGFVENKDRLIPDQNRDVFRSFLKNIEFTPSTIINQEPKKVLFEYTETGRGLFTFLQFMDDWALEQGVLSEMRTSLNVVVFQGAVEEGQTPARDNVSFSPYSTSFITMSDTKTLKEVCDNEFVRLIPSHKVYKTITEPRTNHEDPVVQHKKNLLLELTCMN